jgi:catechol-2,3-dioxygenase
MNIKQIDHCALTVTNLERSLEWFKKVFGFDIIHKWKTTWMIGKEEIRIGLFQRPEGKPIEDLDNKIGFQHVAFLSDSQGFTAIQVQLKSQGIDFEGPEDTGIAYSIFVSDPDGNQFEVTTYYQDKSSEEIISNSMSKIYI